MKCTSIGKVFATTKGKLFICAMQEIINLHSLGADADLNSLVIGSNECCIIGNWLGIAIQHLQIFPILFVARTPGSLGLEESVECKHYLLHEVQ